MGLNFTQQFSGLRQGVFRALAWGRFYRRALTRYQIHSPFVFDWVSEVLEDDRRYYAFDEINALRAKMLSDHRPLVLTDYGTGPSGIYDAHSQPIQRTSTLSRVTRRSGSEPRQGELLFRLALWSRARRILELGSSVGLSTLYWSKAAGRQAHITALEGCPQSAAIARVNLEVLGIRQTEVVTGPFEHTLASTLAATEAPPDLIFFDGNHQKEATLQYFHTCLPYISDSSIFVFDDVHWSAGMESAWSEICSHPRVTLTIDCGYFACAFFRPEFREKQHFQVVPAFWKPWKIY